MFFVRFVLACVSATVGPSVPADAMDVGVLPATFENTTVMGVVNACAIDNVAFPLSFVGRPIGPFVRTWATLVTRLESTVEARTIVPDLNTKTILKIGSPMAPEGCSILVVVGAYATSLVVGPLTDESVSIAMGKATFSCRSVLDPFTLIHSAIRPYLSPQTVPPSPIPLTSVHSAAGKAECLACFGQARFSHGRQFPDVILEVGPLTALQVHARRGVSRGRGRSGTELLLRRFFLMYRGLCVDVDVRSGIGCFTAAIFLRTLPTHATWM
mmetsp:Transcript_42205/g.90661  ORF Transcript_42205/g.90661 Transcript_42205/m.90661 type:complete len:270 (+) Transcript_42205:372-1181(+)